MQSLSSWRLGLIGTLFAFALTSCQSYAAPGAAADLALFNDLRVDDDIEAAFELQPAAEFPARIAIARVQAPGYESYSTPKASDRGKYSVITTRELEEDADIRRILEQPMIAGVAPMSSMLIPDGPQSERDLRQAAARLRADMLLVYTVESKFWRDGRLMPVAVLSLGLLATDKVHLTSVASALLIDTRTGFIYGAAEATAREDEWQHLATAPSYDAQRLETEREAFHSLVAEFEEMWAMVLASQGLAADLDASGAIELAPDPAETSAADAPSHP